MFTMISPISILALISFFSYFASVRNQSFFSLIGGKQEEDSVIGQHFIHKDFYKCGRAVKCTHAVKYVACSKYEIIYNQDAIQYITEEIIVWEKMNIIRPISNVALGKPAFLSSRYRNSTMASFAVNGQVGTSNCAETKLESSPWLQIDLQNQALIKSIAVYSFVPR